MERLRNRRRGDSEAQEDDPQLKRESRRGQQSEERRNQHLAQKRRQERMQHVRKMFMLLAIAFIAYFTARMIVDTQWLVGFICSLGAYSTTIMLMVLIFRHNQTSQSNELVVTYCNILVVFFVAGLLAWQVKAMHAIDLLQFGENDTDSPLISFSERSVVGKVIFCISTGVFGPPYFFFVVGRDLFPWIEFYLLVIWHTASGAVWRFVIGPISNAFVWVLTSLQAMWQAVAEAVMSVVNLISTSIIAVSSSIGANVKDVFSMLRFQ